MPLTGRVAKLEALTTSGGAAPRVSIVYMNQGDAEPTHGDGAEIIVVVEYVDSEAASGAP